MSAGATPLTPGTWRFYCRVRLAPICLLLVAALHAYRVAAVDQTPWKGGGFGMFSTIDGVAARNLRFYVLTDQGEVAVQPPVRIDKWAGELKTAPTPAALDVLVDRLATVVWVRPGHEWRDVAPADRHDQWVSLPGDDDGHAAERLRLVPLAIGQPAPRPDEIVPVRGVRVEVWRYRFDRATGTLHNERIMERAWQAPGETL